MNHHLFTGWHKSSYSNSSANCVEVATGWRKSTYSNSSANCVEVAPADRVVGVRDSKQHGEGPVLEFSVASWEAFLRQAKAGELDA